MKRAGVPAILGLLFCVVIPSVEAQVQTKSDDHRVDRIDVLIRELIDRIEVMNARIQRLEENEARLVDRIERLSTRETPVPGGTPTASPESVARNTISPSLDLAILGDLYRASVVLQANGRYDEALEGLEEVFESDPYGEMADNALFWIGEIHYARGDFPSAIKIYERIAGDYPDQNKAPDALLRAAKAYGRLGDLLQGRQTLERLIAEYPYSMAAASARPNLERYRY